MKRAIDSSSLIALLHGRPRGKSVAYYYSLADGGLEPSCVCADGAGVGRAPLGLKKTAAYNIYIIYIYCGATSMRGELGRCRGYGVVLDRALRTDVLFFIGQWHSDSQACVALQSQDEDNSYY
jgi:hypothetical protein